jgi:hypothetical protein
MKGFIDNMLLDYAKLPEPVLEDRPEFVELYRTAWELAVP